MRVQPYRSTIATAARARRSAAESGPGASPCRRGARARARRRSGGRSARSRRVPSRGGRRRGRSRRSTARRCRPWPARSRAGPGAATRGSSSPIIRRAVRRPVGDVAVQPRGPQRDDGVGDAELVPALRRDAVEPVQGGPHRRGRFDLLPVLDVGRGGGERELRLRRDRLRREQVDERAQRGRAALQEQLDPAAGDDRRRERAVARRQRVPRGRAHPAALGEPARRRDVHPGQLARRDRVQLGAQQVAHQRVEAEPAGPALDAFEHRVLAREPLELPRAAAAAAEHVRELAADGVGERDPQQEGPLAVRLVIEHLGEQVVGDGRVGAGEVRDEAARVRVPAQREHRHPQAGRPALGAPQQRAGVALARGPARVSRKKAPASASVNARSRARSSSMRPATRSRTSRSGGSRRLRITSRSASSGCSSSTSRSAITSGSETTWKSSSTSTTGLGWAAIRFMKATSAESVEPGSRNGRSSGSATCMDSSTSVQNGRARQPLAVQRDPRHGAGREPRPRPRARQRRLPGAGRGGDERQRPAHRVGQAPQTAPAAGSGPAPGAGAPGAWLADRGTSAAPFRRPHARDPVHRGAVGPEGGEDRSAARSPAAASRTMGATNAENRCAVADGAPVCQATSGLGLPQPALGSA